MQDSANNMTKEEVQAAQGPLQVQQREDVPSISGGQMMASDAQYHRMLSFAQAMAEAKVTVPKHLAGNSGDCLAVAMQAMQWGLNPFVVAQKTCLIHGVLTYEAQLVSAVLTSTNAIKGRLKYEPFGDWEKIVGKVKKVPGKDGKAGYFAPDWPLSDEEGLGVEVSATLNGEDEPRKLRILLKQATVRNSTNWANNPEQQLCYLAAKIWARRHAPDALLGVYTPDEITPEREINPAPKKESGLQSVDPKQAHSSLDENHETISDKKVTLSKEAKELMKLINKSEEMNELRRAAGKVKSALEAEVITEQERNQLLEEYEAQKNYIKQMEEVKTHE